MTTAIDPDIRKVLDLARISGDRINERTIALADRMLILFTGTNGIINHAAAASALLRRMGA